MAKVDVSVVVLYSIAKIILSRSLREIRVVLAEMFDHSR